MQQDLITNNSVSMKPNPLGQVNVVLAPNDYLLARPRESIRLSLIPRS